MNRLAVAPALVALAGCASLAVERGPARAPPVTTARAVHLARVRCLLVAPFENASDDPIAAEAATATFVTGVDGARTTIYPIAELRSLFKDTSMELPEGVSPSLALELAELIGADAALYGAVEGRSRGADAELSVTIRLVASGARDVLFARVVELRPAPEAPLADQVRAAIRAAAAPMIERLGVPGRKACFDRQRTDRLRLMALAGEQRAIYPAAKPVTAALPPPPPPSERPTPEVAGSTPALATTPVAPPPAAQTAEVGEVEILPAFPRVPRTSAPMKVESAADLPEPVVTGGAEPSEPEPAPPTVEAAERRASAAELRPARPPKRERKVAKVTPRPETGAKALTVRQADWLTRLQRGRRVSVEDVAFVGRTGQLERESGLHDVVALMRVGASLKLRVEGFVDSSNDPDGDLRVSMEMARAAGRRLIQLGVARDRLTWAGRGGESPILPNFTARGRQTNRRIELVPVQ